MERFVPTDNEELKKLHDDYHMLAKQVVAYTEDIEKLEEERSKRVVEAEKIKFRLKQLTHEIVTDLGEYEFIMNTVYLPDGGLAIKILDQKESTLEALKSKAQTFRQN